ncbi:MAG TPA: hypothetical protein VFE05_09925 [Longimicrobiaceae bacterium]|jgi:hypothetical protein|nr:hypothetical protein [Longimicrobiaceae bacterium]
MAITTNVYTGSNGTLVLSDETGAEGDDGKLAIDFFELRTVGRVTGVEIRVHTDLQEYHEIGRRHPTSLHPGNIHVSGRITRAHINGGLLNLLLGRGAALQTIPEPYVQPSFGMQVQLIDPASPARGTVVVLLGVKLEDWSFAMPEEDFVMENVTFRALGIRSAGITGQGGGGGGGGSGVVAENPAFPSGQANA